VIIGTAKFWLPVPLGIGVAVAQTRRRRAAAAREENLSVATRTGGRSDMLITLLQSYWVTPALLWTPQFRPCCTLFADLRRGTSDG
jgi:hypothetical protein